MSGYGAKNQGLGTGQFILPPDDVIFGCTPTMNAIRRRLEKVSATDITILIQGDGGSGKELLARWIHRHSPWREGPFIKVNFAAIPGNLLESELFGFEPGAFTGANAARMGRVEMAQGGTLLLDQIADLEPSFQAKMLQLLQDGSFYRLGDQQERRVEARLICATSRRLEEAVLSGRFRQDLYYRINVFSVELPPLSARREDIPHMANYLLGICKARFQREVAAFEPRKLRLLQCRDWRGNIREMENWIARYVILGDERLLESESSGKNGYEVAVKKDKEGFVSLKRIAKEAQKAMSRELILKALQANRWNRRRAAKDLKISYRTLLYEIRDMGLTSTRSHSRAAKPSDTTIIKSTSPE
jgi:two-component system, NtrC family, response regulator AtoC